MPRKVYTHEEPNLLFVPNTPSTSKFNTVVGLANGSGAMSDPYDWGSGARPTMFEWRARSKTAGVSLATKGQAIEIYAVTSDDGTWWDGNMASGDRVLTDLGVAKNFQWIGALNVQTSGSGVNLVSSGLCQIFASKASFAFWNQTGDNLTSVSGDHQFSLKAVPDEIQ